MNGAKITDVMKLKMTGSDNFLDISLIHSDIVTQDVNGSIMIDKVNKIRKNITNNINALLFPILVLSRGTDGSPTLKLNFPFSTTYINAGIIANT